MEDAAVDDEIVEAVVDAVADDEFVEAAGDAAMGATIDDVATEMITTAMIEISIMYYMDYYISLYGCCIATLLL